MIFFAIQMSVPKSIEKSSLQYLGYFVQGPKC